MHVYDRVLPHGALDTLFWLAVALSGVTVLEALFRWSRAYLAGWSAARFQHALTCRAVDHLLAGRLADFEREQPGVHLNRLQAVDPLAEFSGGEARLSVVDFVFVPLFLAAFWMIAGVLVLLPIVLLLLAVASVGVLGHLLRDAMDDRSGADERRSSFLLEALGGLETVKLLAFEPLMMRRYERLRASGAALTHRVVLLSGAAQHLAGLFSTLTMALVAVFGAASVIKGDISIGAMAACMLLAGRSVQPVFRGFVLLSHYQNAAMAKQRLGELLLAAREYAAESDDDLPIVGHIALSNVCFGYQADGPPLLEDIHLTVEAGSFVAVTGDSGTGKSTLLMIVAGLLQPSAGTVHIDGRDLGDLDPRLVRRQVMLLAQRPVLFRGTVLDNLTLFDSRGSMDDGIEAARMLGLDAAISRLPDGYDTEIQDAADANLPEGIRQGIPVARAFVGDTRVVLFDEANAGFDQRGERFLIATLRRIKGTHTILAVTHRPSVLALADRVFVLRNGRLTERVTPTREAAGVRGGLATA
jgi:ATP-binding cassette subfamily C protein LapB